MNAKTKRNKEKVKNLYVLCFIFIPGQFLITVKVLKAKQRK